MPMPTPTAAQVAVAFTTIREIACDFGDAEVKKIRSLAFDTIHHALQRSGWTGSLKECEPFGLAEPAADALAKTTDLLLNASRAGEILAEELTNNYADTSRLSSDRVAAYLALRKAARISTPDWADVSFEAEFAGSITDALVQRSERSAC